MIPRTLILDTSELMEDFYCTTAYMREEAFVTADIVKGIVESIGVESEAEFELGRGCYELMSAHLFNRDGTHNSHLEKDAEIISEATYELGNRLFKKLQRVGAYSRGFLGYKLKAFDDQILVLEQPTDWRQYE